MEETSRRSVKTVQSIFGFLGILLIWEVIARGLQIPVWLLPPPSQIFLYFLDKAGPTNMLGNFLVTLYEVLAGFFLAIVVGVFLGILIAHSSHLERGLYPLLSFFQSVPKSALAPIFIVWFGYGYLPRVIIAFLIVFFPILVNTITGLQITEPELLDMMRSFRASKLQILMKIRFPRSLTFIFSALKIAASTCVIGAVVAEFMSGNSGLGHLTLEASYLLDMRLLFASVFLMAAMSMTMFAVVLIVEKWLIPPYKR